MAENQYGKKLISWKFSEFMEHERTKGWYVAAIIIGVILLIYSVVTANFLFAIILIIATAVIILRDYQGSRMIDFAVYEDGIRIGNKLYDFKEVQNFYIIYEPPEVKNLYLVFGSLVQPRLQIPLDDINPIKVREILLDYLEEDLDKENEPLSDGLGRVLKL